MQEKDIVKLVFDEDYTYSYPDGHRGKTYLKSLTGKYKGLTIKVTDAVGIAITEDYVTKNSFKCDYTILKMWDNVSEEQFDGKNVKLNEDDQKYIASMVYDFTEEWIKSENKSGPDEYIDTFRTTFRS